MISCFALIYQEYSFFKHESIKLFKLQQEYKLQISTLKKNKMMHPGLIKLKTINKNSGQNLSQPITDYNNLIESVEFIKLNKMLEHLKKNKFSYLKQHQLEKLFDLICETYEQECFEDVTVSQNEQLNANNQLIDKPVALTPIEELKSNIFQLSWPINKQSFWLSSYYGLRNNKMHYGIDLAAIRGTQVFPAAEGTVEESGYQSGYGNRVVLFHKDNLKTLYAHLDKIYVKVGQKLIITNPLGEVGDTGHTIKSGTDASHLHFEVFQNSKRINPLLILSAI